MKKALITGITGQDGSYLAEFLLGLARGAVVEAVQPGMPEAVARKVRGASGVAGRGDSAGSVEGVM